MSDFKKLLGNAIVNRMKNAGFFDALLGGAGATLNVEYGQQEFNEIMGPQGKCSIFPEPDDFENKAGGTVRGVQTYRLDFFLDDVTGQKFQESELVRALSKTFMDEDRAVLTVEFAALETDGDWLGRSGEVIIEIEPFTDDELEDRPDVSVALRFEGLSWKHDLT